MINDPFVTTRGAERRRAKRSILTIAASLLAAFALVAGVQAFQSGVPAVLGGADDAALPSAALDAVARPVLYNDPQSLSAAFSTVAKQVGPAVVHINVVQQAERTSGLRGFGFGIPEGGGPSRGSGSGVIVNPNGYILTNNHVVGKASSIEVKLADGRRLKGEVVGTDPQTDLAVVKIDAGGLPTAALGDSEALQQGDWVVALGSPFGLEQTITAGIVSATGRRITSSPYDAFIQTDASINPGNSGGPLVNLRGEVVGINTLIFSRTGGNEGIGFAIPSNLARKIYDQLSTGQHRVVRGYLGVNVNDLEPALAEALAIDPAAKGAVVADLAGESSPAAKAGLQPGDVVTAIAGKEVTSAQDLTMTVADIAPGTSVRVDYLRNGKASSADVTVGERPSNPGFDDEEQGNNDKGNQQSRQRLGIQIDDVTPELAQQLKLRIPSGAVIMQLDPNGAAARSGLQRGDVVHRFGRTTIETASDLTAAVQSASGAREIVLQIERNGRLAFVTIQLD